MESHNEAMGTVAVVGLPVGPEVSSDGTRIGVRGSLVAHMCQQRTIIPMC